MSLMSGRMIWLLFGQASLRRLLLDTAVAAHRVIHRFCE